MATFPIENVISACMPLPVCVINRNGKVLSANSKISDVYIYDRIVDGDFFTLTGIKTLDLYEAAETKIFPVISRNDKKFKLVAELADDSEDSDLIVFFSDVTAVEELKEKYRNERLCVAKIEIDKDLFDFQYKIELTNGVDMMFDKNGAFIGFDD